MYHPADGGSHPSVPNTLRRFNSFHCSSVCLTPHGVAVRSAVRFALVVREDGLCLTPHGVAVHLTADGSTGPSSGSPAQHLVAFQYISLRDRLRADGHLDRCPTPRGGSRSVKHLCPKPLGGPVRCGGDRQDVVLRLWSAPNASRRSGSLQPRTPLTNCATCAQHLTVFHIHTHAFHSEARNLGRRAQHLVVFQHIIASFLRGTRTCSAQRLLAFLFVVDVRSPRTTAVSSVPNTYGDPIRGRASCTGSTRTLPTAQRLRAFRFVSHCQHPPGVYSCPTPLDVPVRCRYPPGEQRHRGLCPTPLDVSVHCSADLSVVLADRCVPNASWRSH